MVDIFADEWRESNDYRSAFFKKNKGIFGRIYLCSQCLVPMIDKKKVEVDHVIPPSKLLFGSQRNNIFASLMNTEINTVAICSPCNKRKSNKLGFYVVKGWAARLAFKAIQFIEDAAVMSLFFLLLLIHFTLKFTRKLAFALGKKSFKLTKKGLRSVTKKRRRGKSNPLGKLSVLVVLVVISIIIATKYLK